jgi:hypothetical protein
MIGSGTEMMPVPPMMGSGAQMPMPMVASPTQMPVPMMGSGAQMPMPMVASPTQMPMMGSGAQMPPMMMESGSQMPAVPYKPLGAGDEIEGFNFDDVLNPSPI